MEFRFVDFQRWLDDKWPDEVVGFCGDVYSCPVATWIFQTTGSSFEVVVLGTSIEVDNVHYSCPVWVTHVMDVADYMNAAGEPIRKDEFVTSLNRYMETQNVVFTN